MSDASIADPRTTLPPMGRAGTAVLVSRGADGPEVLMMRRPARGSFADAWVFPGGRLEDVDRVAGETEVDAARRAAARETMEEVGVDIDADALSLVSRWDPPAAAPKRFRTWFFIAEVERTGLMLSDAEVVSAEWLRPEDALARHARGEIVLVPPTWVTLHSLQGYASPGDVVAAATADPQDAPVFATAPRPVQDGFVLVWEPDAAYRADVDLNAPGPRNRLVAGSLPWEYIVRS